MTINLGRLLLVCGTMLASCQDIDKTPTGDGWRMIQDSASPDGNFAVAWGQRGGSKPKMESELHSADFDEKDVVNFIVDLKRGAILGETQARHFGDRQRYNHEHTEVAWSLQNRFVVQTMSWRWFSEISELHEIINGTGISSGTDIIKPAQKAAFEALKDRPQLKRFKERDFGITVGKIAFLEKAGATQLTVKVWGLVPKDGSEDSSFEAVVTFQVIAAANSGGPVIRWIETKLIESSTPY